MIQVVFNRENILSLFEKFGVPKKFDLLSEDSDAYDFFLTEAILEVRLALVYLRAPKLKRWWLLLTH